mmetsp:Transcript_30256/g.58162  ORF Transcript_30256/g.58162 Transcript_30256/m.58162 type:complete len:171 (-) Transcript_30256:225-737(-)|eukprot:CAMPEP_0114249616 /NCGR_PEP_ID=MMETSP0058-20121206/14242_1 /TAXON_ID=36894 /ORGANISM="Pyramimonas parkeae, CCMP726" /LENGTH=170 /DNA_ID=CAMNT_0001363183 /DNA_START=81 /DNA_END=593 /DNA_ORIENTATION=-
MDIETIMAPLRDLIEPYMPAIRDASKNKMFQLMFFLVVTRLIKWVTMKIIGAGGPSIDNAPQGKTRKITSLAEWEVVMKEAKASKALVLVDFFATWCGPCKRLAPIFAELSEKHTETIFLKVDVDKAKDISRSEKISCMPTIKAYKLGQCIETIQGPKPEAIAELIQKHG